jgi:hypothetical protein
MKSAQSAPGSMDAYIAAFPPDVQAMVLPFSIVDNSAPRLLAT